jgi:hypothetical protein
MRKFYDLQADHDAREYRVVERYTGEIIAIYKYQSKENSRGVAHGRANVHRNNLNRRASNHRRKS